MRVGPKRARRALVHPAPPHVHALLGLADKHHPGPALRRGRQLVGAGHLLFEITAAEPHHRDVMVIDETLEVADQPVVVVPQKSGRGDVAGADQRRPTQQELDQPAFVHQVGDIASDPDTIDAPYPQRHVLGQ